MTLIIALFICFLIREISRKASRNNENNMTPFSTVLSLSLSLSRNATPESNALRDRQRMAIGQEAEALRKIAMETQREQRTNKFFETLSKTRC